MADADKTVFISYRRSTSKYLARAIFMDLREHGYDVFLDVNTIDSGAFDTIILNQIAARAHFVVLLSPGTLERCANEGDWLRKEIEEAMQLKRNIVPLIEEGFDFDKETIYLPDAWRAEFKRLNGPRLFHDYFEAGMETLRTRFLKNPMYGEVIPVPVLERIEVERRVEEAISEGPPTRQELSAEEYCKRAYEKGTKGNLEGAIADYSEAIRLAPTYALAYCNRGVARARSGDFDGAIADYSEAIRLNSGDATFFHYRGLAYTKKDSLNAAITDFTEAIRLNSHYDAAYYSRANVHMRSGDFDSAFIDYTESIRLNSSFA